MLHCTVVFVRKLTIFSSVQVLWCYTVGNNVKTDASFNCSVHHINVHKVSFHIKLMMLYNFVNHFFPLCRFIFQIEMVTPQFSTRWFYSVGHSYFSISRHHFYKYSSSHSEVKRMTRDFSGHTVYASILKKQYTQHYLLTNYHRETYNVLFAEGIVSSLQSCTKRKLKGSCHYIVTNL